MKKSIAQFIKDNLNYNEALKMAGMQNIDSEQDFENETTIFRFEDKSKLKFNCIAMEFKTINY